MRKFVLFLTLLSIFGASFAGLTVKGGKKLVTDQETLDNLVKSLGDHLKKLESQGKLELVEIQSATYQTVAGSKYEILAKLKENDTPVDCTITMWEKPWIADFLKLDVECGEAKRQYSYANGLDADRRKRQADYPYTIKGGFSALAQEGLSSAASTVSTIFGLLKNKYPEFDYASKRVLSGESQVVAGLHTILKVEVQPKDGPVKTCAVDYYENIDIEITQVKVECEHDVKIYTWEK